MNEWDIYREWLPPVAWRHAVACCWEQEVGSVRLQRVLPDGHADLLIFEDGRTQLVGLHDHVALPVLAAGTRLHGVRFRPAAVGTALHISASALRNQTVAFEDVVGARRMRKLRDPATLDAWVRSIEPDARATTAVGLLSSHSVTDAAQLLGVTRRHLGRLMLDHVGLSPKAFQRIQRFQQFVRAVDAGTSLAAAAADAGYADQPHVTREVCDFSGVTPAILASERRHS
ncbi:MAG: hypothetical protein QOJ19_2036 [Acidimicrobiia bacterium]|nr:hypothetical protein [Acidimicrobiia bacterium]